MIQFEACDNLGDRSHPDSGEPGGHIRRELKDDPLPCCVDAGDSLGSGGGPPTLSALGVQILGDFRGVDHVRGR